MSTPAKPASPSNVPAPVRTDLPRSGGRAVLLLAATAGLGWAGAFGMLALNGVSPTQSIAAPPRLIFYILVLGAGLLTFVPLQRQLRIRRLALEGIAGTFLLLYTLAFVPPPTGWMLSLPDTPVYAVLAAAIFWSISALAVWPVYAIGQRAFQQRARQYDTRRAWRQAHEIGALAALSAALAGLRVLTVLGVGLLILILIVIELLFLSFVETES